MARPPPDGDSRRTTVSNNVQLPSFSHFVSGLAQTDPPPPPRNRTPTDPSDQPTPSLFPRYKTPLHEGPQHQTSPPQYTTQHSHYIDVRPKGPLQPPRLADPYREHNDPRTIAPNPSQLSGLETSPNRNQHHQIPSPDDSTSNHKTVISETHIDGKGLCYVYDDGTMCQKVINGDMVNPKWGTTKAGKPRKRLGQACNTCREKKIRCDPLMPKCAQCQKFGRECKFESSSRTSKQEGGKDSPSSRDYQTEPYHERTGSSTSAEALTDRSYSRANSRGSMNVESLLSPSSTVEISPSSEQPPRKRPRISSSPKHGTHSPPKAYFDRQIDVKEREAKTRASPCFGCDTDPYQVDFRLTMYYVKQYFKHVSLHIYVLFPSQLFQHWVQHCHTKSMSDKMLLYAILAAGTTFSQTHDNPKHQSHFKNIAEGALSMHKGHALQAVQTRLILSMLEYSLGQLRRSRDLAVDAVRAAYEAGLNNDVEEAEPILGMSQAVFLECRRRTFWLAFIAVSFHGNQFAPNYPVERLACDLRLPCEDKDFGNDQIPDIPRLRYTSADSWTQVQAPRQGSLAFLLEICLITNEVSAWLNIASREISAIQYPDAYDKMRYQTTMKLTTWRNRLRNYYRTPEFNFNGFEILYHFVGMLINRHIRHECLRKDQVERCCKQTRFHAMQLLEMVHLIGQDDGKEIEMSVVAAGCPIAGDTVLMAIDVVTAAGKTSSLLEHHEARDPSFIELFAGGVGALNSLSKHWRTAEEQLKVAKLRIASVSQGINSGKVAWFVRKPLFSPYGLEYDVVYGIPKIRYLQALGYGNEVTTEGDICEMGSQSPN